MLENIAPVKPKQDPADAAQEPLELEDIIVELQLSGKLDDTTDEAIRRQRAMGLPITFQRGSQVITQYSDGREEVIATIKSIPYTLPAGVEIVRRK